MKARLLRLVLASAIGFAALLLLGSLVVLAAPAGNVSPQPAAAPTNNVSAGLSALRAISVPFGIASPLPLAANGRQVKVTGHGTCQQGGDAFQVMVLVTEDSTGAVGFGTAEASCTGEAQTWDTLATAMGPQVFAPGDAQACAFAMVYQANADAGVKQWCKPVKLEASASPY